MLILFERIFKEILRKMKEKEKIVCNFVSGIVFSFVFNFVFCCIVDILKNEMGLLYFVFRFEKMLGNLQIYVLCVIEFYFGKLVNVLLFYNEIKNMEFNMSELVKYVDLKLNGILFKLKWIFLVFKVLELKWSI